jgi:hypothetical protein
MQMANARPFKKTGMYLRSAIISESVNAQNKMGVLITNMVVIRFKDHVQKPHVSGSIEFPYNGKKRDSLHICRFSKLHFTRTLYLR